MDSLPGGDVISPWPRPFTRCAAHLGMRHGIERPGMLTLHKSAEGTQWRRMVRRTDGEGFTLRRCRRNPQCWPDQFVDNSEHVSRKEWLRKQLHLRSNCRKFG